MRYVTIGRSFRDFALYGMKTLFVDYEANATPRLVYIMAYTCS